MVIVKENYSSSFRENMNCILCGKEERIKKDTQKHVIKCPVIVKEVTHPENIKYKDINSKLLTK